MNKYHTSSTDFLIEGTRALPARTHLRYGVPAVAMALVVVLLAGRSFYLQVVQGASFRDRAENNRIHEISIEAPRGIIYDRTGKQLVSNIPATDLVLDPILLPPQEEETALIENLLQLIPELSPEQVKNALQDCRTRGREIIIAKALSHDKVLQLQESEATIRGTRLASSLVRDYSPAHAMAHVLGYTSLVSDEDLTKNPDLLLRDQIGKSGIEKQYDKVLRGQPGVSYREVNASGRPQTDLGVTNPVAGQDISLTLDSELQEFIFGLFSERDGKRKEGDAVVKGAAVVVDPRNGEVLAAVSYPSFDPNAFSQGGNKGAAAIMDANQPLFNRFSDGTYASGSIIKPYLAAAALEENLITPQTTLVSTGGIRIGPWFFPDWKAGGHGVTNVTKALAESVNTFFYAITGGWEGQSGLGVERAKSYMEKFGWGTPTGVDLPSEASGFLPSPDWKEEVKGESWYVGDTYHFGIGQGDILVTPLQVAASTAAIADGKYLRRPHFVAGEDNRKQLPISATNMQVVRAGMRQTVTEGSGRALESLPLPIAGKTGTAQVGGVEDTHAWFTSFAPYDNPQFVVTVLLERGGAGDVDAVPVAKEIWQWLIENRQP
ncbi:MAG: penicillin-binding protein 2 [Candidatus Andersenbacteria bacterium]|nr:penicillin-binding protein 2 [Candidatus Andersenbacteria bacterium]